MSYPTPLELFERHRDRLEQASALHRTRAAWTPFVESPSRKHHPPGARQAGQAAFEARRGSQMLAEQPGRRGWLGAEVSPFTAERLDVQYPDVDVDTLLDAVDGARGAWARARPRERVGVCMELLDRLSQQTFENAYATMHTAGQGFMLAFAGSGASSLDRGLEALSMAWAAMDQIPESATFSRRFGRGAPVTLDKQYRLVPVGTAVVVTCGSYPAWNAWPAMLANLATGNPVVLKPHPNGILPVAIAVETGRALLSEAGFSPDLLTLVADEPDRPATVPLLQHPSVRIIDFTGSQRFGGWIEAHCRDKQVYTETSGCNAVVLESAADLDAVLDAVAQSLCMFSAQMCTAAQNIWVARGGVDTPSGRVDVDGVCARLDAAVGRLVDDPERALGLCGTLQNPGVLASIDALRTAARERGLDLVRDSASIEHPAWPRARSATPLVVRCAAGDRDLYGREHFGPMAFVIEADTPAEALAGATRDARERGSIASYGYAVPIDRQDAIVEAFLDAGASVGINLLRQRPINFTAAFSDFHVTGLNPAGNACLTDLAFVARRFRVVQAKRERAAETAP